MFPLGGLQNLGRGYELNDIIKWRPGLNTQKSKLVKVSVSQLHMHTHLHTNTHTLAHTYTRTHTLYVNHIHAIDQRKSRYIIVCIINSVLSGYYAVHNELTIVVVIVTVYGDTVTYHVNILTTLGFIRVCMVRACICMCVGGGKRVWQLSSVV